MDGFVYSRRAMNKDLFSLKPMMRLKGSTTQVSTASTGTRNLISAGS